MNKILLPLFLIISSIIFGQGNPFPNYQQFGSATTRTAFIGAPHGQKGIIIGRYADTLTANNNALGNYIKFYPGAFIVTDNPRDELWQRNYNATAWISRGSVDITTINFITDSSVAFCFGNGVCDTISMNNFSTVVNNVIQNFNDSTVYHINDSTLVICNAAGSCDTINLGNSLTFNIFLDSTSNTFFLSTCDTVQTLCLGDSCYQQQTCDTIPLTVMPPITLYFNGVERLPNTNIVVFGQADPVAYSNAQLFYDTYLKTTSYGLHLTGAPTHTPVQDIEQNQWSQLNSSIFALRHNGAYQPTYNLLDENNPVRLYFNYTNPFTIPTQGGLAGDTIGFMGDRYGYMIMTNSRGSQTHYEIDDNNAKQVGIFFDTYTNNNEGVSIFAQQTPSAYPFHNNPPTDSTLLSKRVAIFKTDRDIQFPGYPNTRNDGTAPMAFYPDAQGNVKVGPVSGGSNITIINDTTITICSFGDFLCDTFITTTVNAIQYVTILNDSTLLVCDSTNTCDTLHIPTPTGFDRGYFDPNQVSQGDTYHNLNMNNFSVGINLITNPSGVLNFNFLNGNTVSGNENVVWGRNMVVAGNTNFVAATDGQVFSSANYSSTFGDATINRGTAALTANFGNKNWAENGATFGSNNVNGSLSPTVGTANLYSNSFVSGLNNFSLGSVNFVSGSSVTANHTTGFITAFGKSYTVTTPNSFNVGYTTNAFEITANKVRINAARFEEYGGTTTAAANDLTLPNDGNRFTISGATQINAIATANWQDGSKIWFIFTGAPLVKNNTAGGAGTATILLAGRVDFQAAAGDVLYLGFDGTNWYEIMRALASGTATITADNGLTKNTATNVQLFGPVGTPATLLNDRYLTQGAFSLNQTGTTSSFLVNYTNSVGHGLNISTPDGIGVQAISTNSIGVYGESTIDVGVEGKSPVYGVYGITNSDNGAGVQATNSVNVGAAGGAIALLAKLFATDNTTVPVIEINRRVGASGGTPAANIGGSIIYTIATTTTAAGVESNQIKSFWTVPTHASRTSQLDITGVGTAVTNTIMSAHGSGVVGIGISSSYTATRLNVVDNSLAGANMVNLTSTSTAAAGDSQKMLNISLSGANATNGEDTYGIYISNAHSGTNNRNYGIFSQITNGGSTSVGIYSQVDNGSAAISAVHTGSNYAVLASSISGGGISAASTSSVGGFFSTNPTSTNTKVPIVNLQRSSSGGSSGNGIGGSITWDIMVSDLTNARAGSIGYVWANATVGTRTSRLEITGVNGAAEVDLLVLHGDGSVKLRPITATAASAITPAEGMLVFVSNTDATFVSIGIWCYQNGAWKAL